jgi:hypothetical protein
MNAGGRLGHYQSITATPGFPRAVARVISEVRLARLSPEAVARFAPDLAPLLDAFELELKESCLTDWPGVLGLASEAASTVGDTRPRLVGMPTLLLDVPIESEAELVFVHSLVEAAVEVLATSPAADQSILGRLRDQLQVEIEDLDQETIGDEKDASRTDASALANLQHRLFKEEERSLEAKPDDTVEVFSAPGEGRECVEIARRVLLQARLGIPFDRIAVLLRSPEGYRSYLEEAFGRAGSFGSRSVVTPTSRPAGSIPLT